MDILWLCWSVILGNKDKRTNDPSTTIITDSETKRMTDRIRLEFGTTRHKQSSQQCK